ncbi:MAG: hypothetical protein HQK79_09005 [Desulfobacterales bacterium]|nr:hypothetical protein [Desulfobacterales bacterium]MBF0397576.1 hypothetical protein [Desulfobacterales bacterium]
MDILQKIILEKEKEIMAKSVEHAYIFDEQGNIFSRKVGISEQISFTTSELNSFKDKIFIHNHTEDATSLSDKDIILSIIYQFKEIRAVGKVKDKMVRYSATPKMNKIKLNDALKGAFYNVRKLLNKYIIDADNKIYHAFNNDLKKNKINKEWAEFNHLHYINKRLNQTLKTIGIELNYKREII